MYTSVYTSFFLTIGLEPVTFLSLIKGFFIQFLPHGLWQFVYKESETKVWKLQENPTASSCHHGHLGAASVSVINYKCMNHQGFTRPSFFYFVVPLNFCPISASVVENAGSVRMWSTEAWRWRLPRCCQRDGEARGVTSCYRVCIFGKRTTSSEKCRAPGSSCCLCSPEKSWLNV